MNEAGLKLLFVVGLMLGARSVRAQATQPTEPARPTQPTQPAQATQPIQPAQATEPAQATRPAGTNVGLRPISPREAVLQALRNNPSLRAAELDVARAQQEVLAEEGRDPYTFGADASYTRSVSPRLSAGDVVRSSTSQQYTLGTALRRTFRSGTTAEIRLQGERFETDTSQFASTAVGSGYDVIARASVVQPLLRGYGVRVGEAALRAARDSQLLSARARRRVTSELARDVLLSYWEVWFSGEAVAIDRAALLLAKEQENEATARVAQGAMAPADVFTFSTRVAELEESVVLSSVDYERRSMELAQLMGVTTSGAFQPVAAVDPPAAGPLATRADLEAALRSGSVELAEAEAQVRLARTRADVAGEESRPRLDFDAFVQSEGISETVPRAARRAGELRWITAHAGLTFELPLDASQRNAQRASAQLSVHIAGQNLRATRDRIATDAALALTTESSSTRRLGLAERTLALAEKAYQAERARFELGQIIPLQVQEAEDDLRRARLGVARARVDLAQAQVVTQHLSGRLLAQYAGEER